MSITTSSRNEAADALAQFLRDTGRVGLQGLLVIVLATERRNAMERLEAAIKTAADSEQYDLAYTHEAYRLAKDAAALVNEAEEATT